MKFWIRIFIVLAGVVPSIAQPIEVEIIKNPASQELKRLEVLNSPYRETNLSITPDGKFLYFMSARGGLPWSVADYTEFRGQSQYDGDIWFSRKVNGNWMPPEHLPATINTSNAEDEPNISPDGNYVVYQSWTDTWEKDGGPYYKASLFGEVWTKPEGISGGINQFFKIEFRKYSGYATDGATLSPDGNHFMVALAPNYDDTMDIYQSVKNKEDIWTYLKKTNISTAGDERSLFIAGDNKTLYFASDGYQGFGGLDIFKTTVNDDGSFGRVINIGEPFNSESDDYGFIVTASGREAYFVRDGDIHYADLTIANDLIKPLPSVVISGLIQDIYGYPIESIIQLKKSGTDKVKARARSNSATGSYSLSFFKESGQYRQEITAKGHKPVINNFELDEKTGYEEITFNANLVEKDMILIHFDFDEIIIIPEYELILDSLVNTIFEDRRQRLLISGHSDEKGTKQYNLGLSQKRMEAVQNFIRVRGIPGRIMKVDYFGESRPKAPPNAINRDAINRRVEIKILRLKKR